MSEIAQTTIKKGTLFLLTAGEHSFYQPLAACRATQDIDTMSLLDEYLEKYPQQKQDYCFEELEFVKWLITDKKAAEKLNCPEWHLGSYARWDSTLTAELCLH